MVKRKKVRLGSRRNKYWKTWKVKQKRQKAMEEELKEIKKKAREAKLAAEEIHTKWVAEEERLEEEKGKIVM